MIIVPLNDLVIRGSSTTPERLDTVTIECNATANPPANINWMKRTTASERIWALTSTSRISITHQLIYMPSGPTSSSTLTISNMEAADNGKYICEANNNSSSPTLSANFAVCVIGKVMKTCIQIGVILCYTLLSNIAIGSIGISQQDLAINQASRAEFNCSVCPTLTPMFMWNFTQRGGLEMEIIANRSQSLSSEYSLTAGQKSQTLIIGDAQWSHVGVYRCITSINGTIIEAEASLDVLSKPMWYG